MKQLFLKTKTSKRLYRHDSPHQSAGIFLLLYTTIFVPFIFADDASWYPSKYGSEDRIGALNNLKPEIVIEAAKLVKQGKVYSLAIETNESSHDNHSRFYKVKSYTMTPSEIGPNKFTGNESLIISNDGLGTSIDGFAHTGLGRRYYNGATETEVLSKNSPVFYFTGWSRSHRLYLAV